MDEKKFATTSAFSNTQNLSLLSTAKTMMKTFTPELVEEITRRIVAELEPEEIIIFGSYAWGTPNKYSDLDLFIIVTDTPDFDRIEWGVRAGSSLDGLMVDVDIWVTTRSHVERWRQVRGSLERKIVQEGKVLYARRKTQVGTVVG